MAQKHEFTDKSMDDYQEGTILYDKNAKTKIASITFNRPDKMNAFNRGMIMRIRDLVWEANGDDDVKVIIFKGNGPNFGTGADVARLGIHHGWEGSTKRRPSQRQRLHYDNSMQGRTGWQQSILMSQKVTIAQLHGYCYGGHMYFAAICDLVVASDDALFGHPGYRYIGPMGPLPLWILTMGLHKAKELMFTGKSFTAEEALACGLVNKVVPRDQLESEVMEMAQNIARNPSDAITLGKAAFELGLDILGVGAGYTGGYIHHVLATNIRYEEDEFNLFKSRRDSGVSGAIKNREKKFGKKGLARKKTDS